MKKDLIGALAWAGAMIGVAFGARWAQGLGSIDPETATRAVQIVIGLWLVWYGNRIPKAFAPKACARQPKRVAGWSLVLSGLVYVGLWALAPIPVAQQVGTAAVLTALVVVLGFVLTARGGGKAA